MQISYVVADFRSGDHCFSTRRVMTLNEVRPEEYSALLVRLEASHWHYQSFPKPHVLPQEEEHSFEVSAKYTEVPYIGRFRLYIQRLLEALPSTRSLQDHGSAASSEFEAQACFSRVCTDSRPHYIEPINFLTRL